MSQHHRARDVMTEVHWANNNYFIHYGGAGLDMFQMVGYDPCMTRRTWGSHLWGSSSTMSLGARASRHSTSTFHGVSMPTTGHQLRRVVRNYLQ
jgi:hypothetical protein